MKRRTAVISVLLGALVLAYLFASPSWFRPLLSIYYPHVEWITTSELAERLEEGGTILVDVRDVDEYTESRIPGAQLPGAIVPEGEVVVYCSLGVRSAEYAERLRARGVHALNLAGGIFAWANEARPLENDEGSIGRVHPYNPFFGIFVDAERRALP